jgi:hypothetical protein
VLQPAGLRHTIGHGPILGLGTRAGDDVLMLRRPGDEVGAEEHSVARGGLACVRATRLLRISVDCQLEGGRAPQEKAII